MSNIARRYTLLIITILISMPTAIAHAREPIPAPEPTTTAGTTLASDNLPAPQAPDGPATGPATPPRADLDGHAKALSPEKAGGLSVVLNDEGMVRMSDVAVASNGDLFAVSSHTSGGDYEVVVYRSGDGGASWTEWGSLDESSGKWGGARIVIAEGDVDRCYLAMRRFIEPPYKWRIWVAWADLDDATADFATTATSVLNTEDVHFDKPRMLADDFAYSGFYLYLVAEGDEGNGTDIWFARSTDFGVTWETPYTIATINVNDRHYERPDIAMGQDGRLHVAWNFENGTTTLDDAIRVRSVADFAFAGSAAWESIRSLTSTSNGIEESAPRVAASSTSGAVVITEMRAIDEGTYDSRIEPGVFVSADAGTTFTETIISDGLTTSLTYASDVVLDTARSRWIFAGNGAGGSNPAFVYAPLADPTDWSAQDPFEHQPADTYLQTVDIVVDSTHDDRIAAVWFNHLWENDSWDSSEVRFDAEWRGDAGWPVPFANFPVALDMTPRTDPCLADLDDDGDLEILCGYGTRWVGAWHDTGSPVAGWPVDAGGELSPAPIAVGDLTGDGQPLVVVCRADGAVRAFDGDGSTAWTRYNSEGPAYASIGAFGGPEWRQIVVFAGQNVKWLDSGGATIASSSLGFAGSAMSPPAIGDVDGDGQAEAVLCLDDAVIVQPMRWPGTWWSRHLSAPISGSPALLNIDDDDDVEIAVPTRDGRVFLLDDDGVDYPAPGWPFDTGAAVPLSGLTAAAILPGSSWEIAFTGADRRLQAIGKNASYADGFPVTLAADLAVTPMLAPVDGDGADLLFPDADGALHAWHYKDGEMPGWPVPVTPGLDLSPSIGDLDGDNILDIVWLTENSLHACSLGQPVGGPRDSWPMAYYDARRSSCADCAENLVSGVADDEREATVSFAAPGPNPVYDRTAFSFVLPRAADVTLDVYDLRGRRVARLLKGTLAPGAHRETWTGRDDAGRQAASGHYLARLRVDGEVLSRKITLVR